MPKANQPRQGRNVSHDFDGSFAALRLSRSFSPIPTAHAVGYRSFAAPRLSAILPENVLPGTSNHMRLPHSLKIGGHQYEVGSLTHSLRCGYADRASYDYWDD